MNVPLALIRIDGGTQPRAEINLDTVNDYAQAMEGGAEFPPVSLYHDGATYWLADGFHRYHAARELQRETLPALIYEGTQREAILFSVGANQYHGLRRSNQDKRRAVEMLLADEEWVQCSDRWIAEQCGVSNRFVGIVRKELCTVHSCDEPRTGKDGKTRKLPEQHEPEPPCAEVDSEYDQDLSVIEGAEPGAFEGNASACLEAPPADVGEASASEPNEIGRIKARIDETIRASLLGQPAHVRVVIADYLQDKCNELSDPSWPELEQEAFA